MKKEFNSKLIENIIYSIIWLLIFLMPIFFSGYEYQTNWRRVYHEWIRFIPFFIIFLINNSILVPKLLFEKRYNYYLFATFFMVLIIAYLGSHSRMFIDFIEQSPPDDIMPRDDFRSPLEFGRPDRGGPPPRRQVQPWHVVFFNNVIISFLIVGFNAAIKLSFQWAKNEQEKKELEKEHLQSELNFLKHQISPHFFMNTLNNIHALIDIEKEDAKDAIIRLSKMMRHLLYDAEKEKSNLKKEIEFIKSYLDLMRLRFSSKVKIKTSFPENTDAFEIPPLLFTSLLENAFKHGISYQTDSFIDVTIELKNRLLQFSIANSKHQKSLVDIEKGGIGLSNLKKRLNLLYGKSYELTISDGMNEFFVTLIVPLN